MRRVHLRHALVIVPLAILLVTGVLIVVLSAPPWVPSGRLVIAVRAVPADGEAPPTLVLGVDDITLVRADGTSEKVTAIARRITLDQAEAQPRVIVDSRVPAGSYTGITFAIRSPEQRETQEGVLSEPVVLGDEHVHLALPLEVRELETQVALLGFETTNTLHDEGGVRVYLPVIQAEIRTGGTVEPSEGSLVRITAGTVAQSAVFGMDWDGAMRLNYRPPVARPAHAQTGESMGDARDSSDLGADMEPPPEEQAEEAIESATSTIDARGLTPAGAQEQVGDE